MRFLTAIFFSLLLLAGCSSDSKVNHTEQKDSTESQTAYSSVTDHSVMSIEGYILKKQGGRILVVSPEPQDFSSTGGVKEFYDAIWFSNPPKHLSIGQKVKVFFEHVAQSYPGQAGVKDIEVIPDVKPNGANMTQTQVIQNALTVYDYYGTIVAKDIGYNQKTDDWDITILDDKSEIKTKIDDITQVTYENNVVKEMENLNWFVKKVESGTVAVMDLVTFGIEGQRVVDRLHTGNGTITNTRTVDKEYIESYSCETLKVEENKNEKVYKLMNCEGDFKGLKDFDLLKISN